MRDSMTACRRVAATISHVQYARCPMTVLPKSGRASHAQPLAFEAMWRQRPSVEETYAYLANGARDKAGCHLP